MRRLAVFAGLLFASTLASPAHAQLPEPWPNDNLRWMEQEQQRQHALQVDRDLMALDNQLRASEALQAMRDQRQATAQAHAAIARARLAPGAVAPSPAGDIPDDWLAASNARVRAASQRVK